MSRLPPRRGGNPFRPVGDAVLPSPIPAVVAGSGTGPSTGRRGESRLRLGVEAQVVLITGSPRVVVENLSRTGARIAMDHPPQPGESCVLQVCGIEAFGDVVWSRGQRFGIRFDERLPQDAVVAVRRFADDRSTIENAQRQRMARDFVSGSRRW